jgi:hypothetical protein
MSTKTVQVRVFEADLDRLKNFGRAGDSLAIVFSKVLALAEANYAQNNTANQR